MLETIFRIIREKQNNGKLPDSKLSLLWTPPVHHFKSFLHIFFERGSENRSYGSNYWSFTRCKLKKKETFLNFLTKYSDMQDTECDVFQWPKKMWNFGGTSDAEWMKKKQKKNRLLANKHWLMIDWKQTTNQHLM